MSDIDELLDQVGKLAEALTRHDLVEVEVERDGLRIKVRRQGATEGTPREKTRAEATVAPPPEVVIVRSPIVGTFYRAPEPGAPPFVDVGTPVSTGQVLCIIEAMKLMNEIDAECDGTVETIFVDSGQPVQYGQELFAIRSSSPRDVPQDPDRESR